MNIVAEGNLLPTVKEFFNMIFTFFLTINAWIFFRSNSVHESILYLKNMYSSTLYKSPDFVPLFLIILIILFILIEWVNRNYEFGFHLVPKSKLLRWSSYIILSSLILAFMGNQSEFIYFQF